MPGRQQIEDGRPHCKDHCSACGTCFRSTRAFELHRYGHFKSGRKCRAPENVLREGEPRLEPMTDDGICDARQHVEGVTVWREIQ